MADSIVLSSPAFIDPGAFFVKEISVIDIPKNVDDMRAFYTFSFDPNAYSFLVIAAKKSSFRYRGYYSNGTHSEGRYSLNREEMIYTAESNISDYIWHNSSGDADIYLTVDFTTGVFKASAHRGRWDSSDTYGWEFQADIEFYICLE